MSHHDTHRRAGATHRMNRPLAAAVLVVALAACGATGQMSPTPRGPGTSAALPLAGDAGSPFDLDRPTIAHLDPALLDALQAAAREARQDGVELLVTSGWRSPAHQQRLFDEAVREHGSEDEARRYVATPDTSAHVTGDAVDIGPTDADDWLVRHGADHGLCQVFANELWHFELATSPGGRCPDLLPDGSSRG